MGLNERLDSLQRVLIPESFKNSLISSGRVHFSNGTSYYASGLTLPASFNINNLIGV